MPLLDGNTFNMEDFNFNTEIVNDREFLVSFIYKKTFTASTESYKVIC